MLNPGKISFCLLILLAGCSTPARRQGARVPDWNAGAEPHSTNVVQVTEGPRITPPPAAEQPAGRTSAETWIPLQRWTRENNAGSIRQLSTGSPPSFALNASNGILVVQPRNLAATWNGQTFHFGFAPQLIDNQPFVHILDLQKNIEPLLRSFTPPTRSNRVVVIDPGHGGEKNPGARSIFDGALEKELTLDWAKRLAPLLAADGWQVFVTRDADVDLTLGERVAIAEEKGADLFISLHFNSAAPNQQQEGMETFCLTPSGMPSTLTRGYEDDATLVLPNNSFDAENLSYAMRLQKSLLRGSGAVDRGVRRARFMGVLRGQNRPAILLEGGYLSNPQEARRIADPAYRQKLAEAVADGLRADLPPAAPAVSTNRVSLP